MSFRTRNEENYSLELGWAWIVRAKKPFQTCLSNYARRTRFLAITRNDMLFILVGCLLFLLSACGNKPTSNESQQAASQNETTAASDKKNILFFGDSLTAGYGLEDPDQAFPGVIQHRLDSLKMPYNVINAGVSGETTAGGLGRIDWVLKQKVSVFILELGANDGLRGIPTDETSKNLQAIINKVKAKYPNAKIILAGMQVPPSMGADYANSFKAVFPTLAQKNKIDLIPFLLDNVAGIPKLNQKDGIHPTAEGAKIVAGNVWGVLKDDL